MCVAAFAELTELQTFFDSFFVFVRSISDRLALRTLKLGHVVLGHSGGMLANDRYQVNGAESGARTRDLRFTKPLLYQLSYFGVIKYSGGPGRIRTFEG